MSADDDLVQRAVFAGEVCARCVVALPTAPPQHAKRLCLQCGSRSLREIVAWVGQQGGGYGVAFLEADGQTRVGRRLWLSDSVKMLTLLTRGNVTDVALATYEQHMRSWGQTSVRLWLDPKQYASLVADGIRRPWNGYEERKRQGRG